jgi:hypothetical protein
MDQDPTETKDSSSFVQEVKEEEFRVLGIKQ